MMSFAVNPFAAIALFPLGMFCVSQPAQVPLLAAAGCNAFQTGERNPATLRALGSAAQTAGLKMLAFPDGLMAEEAPAAGAPAAGLPMLAWYLADEPDVTGMTQEQLVTKDRAVRAWSPGTLTTFVVGDGGDAPCFDDAATALMVDWYPVPHWPVATVGDHVRWTVDAARGRPVWAVLQAFDWRDCPQRNPKAPRIGRFPTAVELRCMAYLAIANGATGIFWFQTTPNGRMLTDDPAHWALLAPLIKELAWLTPGIVHGKIMPAGRGWGGLAARAWRDGDEETAVLVNPSADRPGLVPLALKLDGWRPLFADPGPGAPLPPLGVSILRRTLRHQ